MSAGLRIVPYAQSVGYIESLRRAAECPSQANSESPLGPQLARTAPSPPPAYAIN